jgi:hypothetical protein
VLASVSSIGVPVKPMNEALRQRVAHVAREAVDEVVLAAVRLVGDDHDVAPVGQRRERRSPFSSGKNFWMVVNTTPPAATLSSSRRCARLSGLHRRLAQQVLAAREGAEELVVEVVAVGEHDQRRVLHRRLRMTRPA